MNVHRGGRCFSPGLMLSAVCKQAKWRVCVQVRLCFISSAFHVE